MSGLPSGTVTMLFSDVEGSTALLSRLGEGYVDALDAHRRLLRSAWQRWNGAELGTEGDSFFVVFDAASDATRAAVQAQRDLAAHRWPGGARLTVRMGMHTGEPRQHDGGYVGMDVHVAARVSATAHGGQVVLSEATSRLVEPRLDQDLRLLDLGWHRMKDIPAPEHIFQLCADGLADSFPPLRSLGTTSNLPQAVTPLVGRDRELAELVAVLSEPETRLVTLTGTGGAGKTRLATSVAAALVSAYPDGVFFVPLAAVTEEAAMWATVAEVLGATGADRDRSRFLEWVAGQAALLLLDNLEQLPDAAQVVHDLLAAAPNLAVLATSRRPLHLHGEHEFPVWPLALPAADDGADAADSAAVELFCRHARLVRPRFAVTDDNVADVVRLCRRLDGLPLALELAAARIKLLSPAAVLARLDQPSTLAAHQVGRPERQQTLHAAIGWSHDLLTPRLQAFFRRLGVFAGGADLDAVAAVAPAGHDLLESVGELVDASLVMVADGPDGEPRLRILETIRDFALARLEEAGELDLVRRVHAEHYTALAARLRSQIWSDQPLQARDSLDLELDNLRAVLDWALPLPGTSPPTAEQTRIGANLCHQLYRYWIIGHRAEARKWYERAIQALDRGDSEALADTLLDYGAFVSVDAEWANSIEVLTRALQISRRIGAEDIVSATLRTLGEVRSEMGDFEAARRLLEESLEHGRTHGFAFSVACALKNLGRVAYLAGDPAEAIIRLSEARDIFLTTGVDVLAADCTTLLAGARLAAGEVEEAAKMLTAQITGSLLGADPLALCELAEHLALVAAHRGEARRAARLVGAAAAHRGNTDELLGPADVQHLNRQLAGSRLALGETDWERAVDDGRRTGLEQLLQEVHAASERVGPTSSHPR